MYLKLYTEYANEEKLKELYLELYNKKRHQDLTAKELYPLFLEQMEFYLSSKLSGGSKFSFTENEGWIPVEVESKEYSTKEIEENYRNLRYIWNEKQWLVSIDGMTYSDFIVQSEENFKRDVDTCILYGAGR